MLGLLQTATIAFCLAGEFVAVTAATAAKASPFVGSTTTFQFPPANVTVSATAANFPDAAQVGFPGPTPTGDEAEAIATAAFVEFESTFPLVQPNTSDNAPTSSFNILKQWGNLSPWSSVGSFGLESTPQVPAECQLNQVFLLHRHGARYPTSGSSPAQFAASLHSLVVNGTGFSASGPLSFLNSWTYKLGAEILTPFGRQQLFNLGSAFRVKYGDLLKGFDDLPVFRTTSENRMVDSALHFAAGFFGVMSYQEDYHQLITIEQDGFNNTLAPYDLCNNSNSAAIGGFGSTQAELWIAKYLQPAVERLQPHIQGLELNTSTLFAMQQTCAYETVALGFSSFCDLFTADEWKGFSYSVDLSFWYSNGPGNPTSAAIGIGYVQETISRLTQTRITDFDTSVNGTIVTDPTLFPFGQPIYVDATHDTIISAIVTAFNFTSMNAGGPLPTDHIPNDHTYKVQQISPFSSNLVGQVLSCPANSANSTHIRWILNDGVLPLTGIKGCTANKDGLCELPTFISSMEERIAQVDYQFDCFANYTIPLPDDIVDGRLPDSLRNTTA